MKGISAFKLSFGSSRLLACGVLSLAFCVVGFAQSSQPPEPVGDASIIEPILPPIIPLIPIIEQLCTGYQICSSDPVTGRQTCRPGPCPLAEPHLTTAPAAVMISEFRFRGPNGVNDEFVELYNNTNYSLLVA